jgi:flagellum-specific peptidoglycan hydrolase FlgJ
MPGLFVLILGVCGFIENRDAPEWHYIQQHKQFAIAEMELHGIPASIKLAQALVESDAGRSILATRANNHFGIKCKSWWTGDQYYYADDDFDAHGRLAPSCFRFYDSAQQSFTDHSQFLKYSGRYTRLFSLGTDDYRRWAQGLQDFGYATSRNYSNTLIGVIEKYHLYELDEVPIAARPR